MARGRYMMRIYGSLVLPRPAHLGRYDPAGSLDQAIEPSTVLFHLIHNSTLYLYQCLCHWRSPLFAGVIGDPMPRHIESSLQLHVNQEHLGEH